MLINRHSDPSKWSYPSQTRGLNVPILGPPPLQKKDNLWTIFWNIFGSVIFQIFLKHVLKYFTNKNISQIKILKLRNMVALIICFRVGICTKIVSLDIFELLDQ